jgi:hypothetical protein
MGRAPEDDDGWTGGGRWFDVASVAFITLFVGVFAAWSLFGWESFRDYERRPARAWMVRIVFPAAAVICAVWLRNEVRGYLRWRRRSRSRRG